MRNRHRVVIQAVIQEDGNVAWQSSSEVRARLDVVGFPATLADEGCRDQADCSEAGLRCLISKSTASVPR